MSNPHDVYRTRIEQMPLTRLNLRTTARFEKCAGNHIPGNQWVQRWTGKRYDSFPCCKRCQVPMIPRHYRWTDRSI